MEYFVQNDKNIYIKIDNSIVKWEKVSDFVSRSTAHFTTNCQYQCIIHSCTLNFLSMAPPPFCANNILRIFEAALPQDPIIMTPRPYNPRTVILRTARYWLSDSHILVTFQRSFGMVFVSLSSKNLALLVDGIVELLVPDPLSQMPPEKYCFFDVRKKLAAKVVLQVTE